MGSVDRFIFLGSTPETLPNLPRKMAKYGQKLCQKKIVNAMKY